MPLLEQAKPPPPFAQALLFRRVISASKSTPRSPWESDDGNDISPNRRDWLDFCLITLLNKKAQDFLRNMQLRAPQARNP